MKQIIFIFFACFLGFFQSFIQAQTTQSQKPKIPAYAKIAPVDFKIYDMPSLNENGTFALIISGIQGDESGAYNATNLLLSHYKIKKGRVRVIPNLSPHTMLFNKREIYGDMNRKFAKISESDPEFAQVQRVKAEILKPEVQAILHMHDGSGFYKPTYINEMQNPHRWGNCSIIDEETMQLEHFSDLNAIAQNMAQRANSRLLKELHRYYVRNTHTAKKDREMQKSLTYFAVTNGKAAVAHEASKTLPLREKVYYHLLGIEGFLDAIGVEYERDFELEPHAIAALINDHSLSVKFQNLSILPLFNLKSPINLFPMPAQFQNDLQKMPLDSQSFILGVAGRVDGSIVLKYGNRNMGVIRPLFLEFDDGLDSVEMSIDGERKSVKIGSIVDVKNEFIAHNIEGYRANIIGFVKKGDTSPKPQEFDVLVPKSELIKKFSVDNAGKIYRIEIYKGEKFAGMILVKFI